MTAPIHLQFEMGKESACVTHLLAGGVMQFRFQLAIATTPEEKELLGSFLATAERLLESCHEQTDAYHKEVERLQALVDKLEKVKENG